MITDPISSADCLQKGCLFCLVRTRLRTKQPDTSIQRYRLRDYYHGFPLYHGQCNLEIVRRPSLAPNRPPLDISGQNIGLPCVDGPAYWATLLVDTFRWLPACVPLGQPSLRDRRAECQSCRQNVSPTGVDGPAHWRHCR
jgi:hypothetical protein